MKVLTVLIFVLIPVLSLFGCKSSGDARDESTLPADTADTTVMMIVPVDWSDFIKINGVTYIGDFRETEITPDRIGERIGEVSCGVPIVYTDGRGNITDDTPADGASFLCSIGTELFSVKDSAHSIAALVNGRYYLYSSD